MLLVIALKRFERAQNAELECNRCHGWFATSVSEVCSLRELSSSLSTKGRKEFQMIRKWNGNDGLLYSLEKPLIKVYLQHLEMVYNCLLACSFVYFWSALFNIMDFSTQFAWFLLPRPHWYFCLFLCSHRTVE